VYEVWLDQILPAKAIEDNIETVEKLGHKVAVKVSMTGWRLWWPFFSIPPNWITHRQCCLASPVPYVSPCAALFLKQWLMGERIDSAVRMQQELQAKQRAEEGTATSALFFFFAVSRVLVLLNCSSFPAIVRSK
jgi:hypothetical protein